MPPTNFGIIANFIKLTKEEQLTILANVAEEKVLPELKYIFICRLRDGVAPAVILLSE